MPSKTSSPDMTVSRRTLVKAGAAVGASAAVISRLPFARADIPSEPDPTGGVGVLRRTTCMMCNAGCGVQARVHNGVAIKLDGNPFCPHTNEYATAGAEAVPTDLPSADTDPGSLCPRGQAGLMTLYDPLRLRVPLKRTGPRGSGQWQAISWQQAISEIVWGGTLPDGTFEGLAAIRNVTDKFSASDTAHAAEAKGGDPANFGFKSNQLLMLVGRDQIGEATGRFMTAFGSVNRIDHTSICNASYKGAGYATFVKENADKGTFSFKPDMAGATYVLLFGTNPAEANVTNPLIRSLSSFKKAGGKLVVVDPRFSNTAAKADKWVGGIHPGTDAALALGICRWIIDNGRHAADALRRPHKGAPNPSGSTTWCDAAYLINLTTHRYLTCADAGLTAFVATSSVVLPKSASVSATSPFVLALDTNDGAGNPLDLSTWPSAGNVKINGELFYFSAKDNAARTLSITARKCKLSKDADHAAGSVVTLPYTVRVGGQTRSHHEVDAGTGLPDLEYDGTVGADAVQTVFSGLKDSMLTVAGYASACGVAESEIAAIASEMTAAGVRACADMYRGSCSHTNGFHTVRAIYLINILLDRIDRRGGYQLSKRYKAGTPAHPNAPKPTGVRLDRAMAKYEGTLPVPTRPWFPHAYSGVQPEVFPALKAGYPYPVKALITYTSNTAYTTPYNHTVQAALLDRSAVPLFVAVDIFMSETTSMADYVLPDVTYLERWSNNTLTGYSAVHTSAGSIRQPVVGAVDPVTKEYMPAIPGPKGMDDILIAFGKEMGLPGYGVNGMGTGKDLDQAWQYYNEMYKSGDFGLSQGLEDLNDPVLLMAGRRKNPSILYDGSGEFAVDDAKYGNVITIYSEAVATTKHSMSGDYFSGLPIYEPPAMDATGHPVVDPPQFDLGLVHYKPVQHVQSRSASNAWLHEIEPVNGVWLNPSDAQSRGIADGDRIRVRSPKYASYGVAQLTEGVRPGCIGIGFSFGRWEAGARPHWVDGEKLGGDGRVATGIAVNPLIRPDPVLKDVCLIDPIGGGADFYSTRVAVEKA